jgi:hypothetical protein
MWRSSGYQEEEQKQIAEEGGGAPADCRRSRSSMRSRSGRWQEEEAGYSMRRRSSR